MPLLPLIGHDALRARLADQVSRGTLPSSLLLHGPAGVGKQRLALALGVQLLCSGEKPPCGACEHCRFSAELQHPDLTWVFPRPRLKDASDISPDEVALDFGEAIADRMKDHGLYARPDGSNGIYVYVTRMILHRASMSPALARRKVFVIGDAERMVPQTSSQEAANAFLKLLEEPPADTTLILTSSEPGALLPTIRSRTIAVRVPALPDDDVRRFIAVPEVAAALAKAGKPDELVGLAGGAPGTLLEATARKTALDRARVLLEAAGGGREKALRAAFMQGSSKSRGTFSDVLDALTVLLHDRARTAARTGDERGALASASAIPFVEEAKRLAETNAVPQLVAAHLLRQLREGGA